MQEFNYLLLPTGPYTPYNPSTKKITFCFCFVKWFSTISSLNIDRYLFSGFEKVLSLPFAVSLFLRRDIIDFIVVIAFSIRIRFSVNCFYSFFILKHSLHICLSSVTKKKKKNIKCLYSCISSLCMLLPSRNWLTYTNLCNASFSNAFRPTFQYILTNKSRTYLLKICKLFSSHFNLRSSIGVGLLQRCICMRFTTIIFGFCENSVYVLAVHLPCQTIWSWSLRCLSLNSCLFVFVGCRAWTFNFQSIIYVNLPVCCVQYWYLVKLVFAFTLTILKMFFVVLLSFIWVMWMCARARVVRGK